MASSNDAPPGGWIDHAAIDRRFEAATRETLLEHARMGRSVSEWRDGKSVTVTPTEIFARYGLDENGKPKPEQKEEVRCNPTTRSCSHRWTIGAGWMICETKENWINTVESMCLLPRGRSSVTDETWLNYPAGGGEVARNTASRRIESSTTSCPANNDGVIARADHSPPG